VAIWSRLFSGIFGVGVGIAAADAVEPVIEVAKQDAWKANQNRILALGQLAELIAQGLTDLPTAVDEAARQGYTSDKLGALAQLALRAPNLAEAQTIERRKIRGRPDLHHAYAKAQIEPQYWPALDNLLDEHLSPEVVALAMVRGLIDDQGILPVPPPTAPGKVPQFPRFNVDGVAESASDGVDLERLKVLVGISGRPMSPEAAALAVFKGIIEKADYDRAVGEGDVRNEWAEAIYENSRYVPSVETAAGLWLRGWKTEAEALAIAELHGATLDTLRNEYLNRGRPATPRQTHLGYARGATLPGAANEDAALDRSVQESDTRTDWAEIEKANRWSYPSPFVVRQLTQSGAFSQAEAHQILIEMGWKPEYATLASQAWATTQQAGTQATWTKRAATQLWTKAHREYLLERINNTQARALLRQVGVPNAEVTPILDLWAAERGITVKELTPTQIKKGYREAKYTFDQAMAFLIRFGYTVADATTLLAE
jgi:hypothetical protein